MQLQPLRTCAVGSTFQISTHACFEVAAFMRRSVFSLNAGCTHDNRPATNIGHDAGKQCTCTCWFTRPEAGSPKQMQALKSFACSLETFRSWLFPVQALAQVCGQRRTWRPAQQVGLQPSAERRHDALVLWVPHAVRRFGGIRAQQLYHDEARHLAQGVAPGSRTSLRSCCSLRHIRARRGSAHKTPAATARVVRTAGAG